MRILWIFRDLTIFISGRSPQVIFTDGSPLGSRNDNSESEGRQKTEGDIQGQPVSPGIHGKDRQNPNGGVARGVKEVDKQEASTGMVEYPGHDYRQGNILEDKKSERNVVMEIPGNPEERHMPDSPGESQDEAGR